MKKEQTDAVNAARTHIIAAADCLTQAERVQSDSDPIEGPGSSEWEIMRAILGEAEAAIEMAHEADGKLEALLVVPEEVGNRLWQRDRLTDFLRARPDLKMRIQADVVSNGGPGAPIVKCTGLVFNADDMSVHYGVILKDDPDEYGSSIECTDDECQAGFNWKLDKASQGFG